MGNTHGFTLVELILTIVMFGLLAGLSLPVYFAFQTRNDLHAATETLGAALRRAQQYSRGVQGDSQWGVAVQGGAITLFKGTSYAARDTAFDERISIASSVTATGPQEVLFSKLSGAPSTTTSMTLQTDQANTRAVTFNAKGLISY